LANAYHVWVEKSMYGKKYFGSERTTFIIGPDQRIVQILKKVKSSEHIKDLRHALFVGEAV
jgi:peroxiredoxin Q/BCP